MDQFLSALRERGVPEENLTQMAEDKNSMTGTPSSVNSTPSPQPRLKHMEDQSP